MATVGIVVLVSLYVGTLVLSCTVCWGLPAAWTERFEQILDGTPATVLEPPGGATIAPGSGSRAEEWDAVERDRLRAAEEERRRAARERRLYLLGEIRESSWSAILAANLSKLNELLPMLAADGTPVLNADGSPVMVSSAENVGVARQMLGTLRMMFFGALKGERLEMGEPTEIVADVDIVQFRADELAAAEQGVAQWREERKRQSG